MSPPRLIEFAAGDAGHWRIDRIDPVVGAGLEPAPALDVRTEPSVTPGDESRRWVWRLLGQLSNIRYAERAEIERLRAIQEGLGRPEATRAAPIPITKSDAWWGLAQDERRDIVEKQSRHIAIGLEYLPGVSRQLHHCRDLGQPFDFLTWFEYAPDQSEAFETLVQRLRDTPEWAYVDREVDIRLSRT